MADRLPKLGDRFTVGALVGPCFGKLLKLNYYYSTSPRLGSIIEGTAVATVQYT